MKDARPTYTITTKYIESVQSALPVDGARRTCNGMGTGSGSSWRNTRFSCIHLLLFLSSILPLLQITYLLLLVGLPKFDRAGASIKRKDENEKILFGGSVTALI